MVLSQKGPEGGWPQGQAEGTRMYPILPAPGIRGALTCFSQVSASQAPFPGCPGCSVLPERCAVTSRVHSQRRGGACGQSLGGWGI